MEPETRTLNVSFNKAGSGSTSARLIIPKTWVDAMGITEEERAVDVTYNGDTIVIKKHEIIIASTFYQK